jgi:transposase
VNETTGYGIDHAVAAAGGGSATSTWTFADLAPGYYRVAATWPGAVAAANNSPFTVRDGAGQVLGHYRIGQGFQLPNDFTAGGAAWENLGVVRLDGSTACMTIDGATNTEVFYAYVRSILCPTLRPGDIVIMDNLGAHKNKRTAALIKAAGAHLRFLPAYSPDLNPIEMMWSKVKALLRAAEARNQPDLQAAIGHALRAVTPQDALGWFTACGYSFI